MFSDRLTRTDIIQNRQRNLGNCHQGKPSGTHSKHSPTQLLYFLGPWSEPSHANEIAPQRHL